MTNHREFAENTRDGRWPWLFWGALFIASAVAVQMYLPYPVDDDTAYHFSVARLMADNGVLHSFPWTRFSWQANHYADKEFLFHLLFVPVAGLGFNTASRIVGSLCGTLVLVTVYRLLRAERVRDAGLWTLVPLTVSIFVYRFAQVRPQLLSIALAILFLHAYARGRLWRVAIVSLLYPLSYVAFWQLPLLLVIAVEAARFFSGERLHWKPATVAVAGIAVGVALHPNSLNLLEMNRIHMVDILFKNAWGDRVEFNMGEEFEPFSILEWLQFLIIPAVMLLWAVYASWRNRRGEHLPLAFAIAACLFACLTIRSNRFLEYFVPFAAVALALASAHYARRHLAAGICATSLVMTLGVGTIPFENLRSMQSRNWEMNSETARLFAGYLPAGATVFTSGWEYTGSLLLNLPGRYYMVALDPTLMYRNDPKLYDDWYRLLLDPPDNAPDIIRSRFASRYVICRNHKPLWPFFEALSRDPTVRGVYADDKWLLFDLGEGELGKAKWSGT